MTLEVSGERKKCRQGLKYLQEQGVNITPIAQKISRDENSCVHCGLCTALCPTKALRMDTETRMVVFQREKCSACGICTNICPMRAMVLEMENGPWETVAEGA